MFEGSKWLFTHLARRLYRGCRKASYYSVQHQEKLFFIRVTPCNRLRMVKFHMFLFATSKILVKCGFINCLVFLSKTNGEKCSLFILFQKCWLVSFENCDVFPFHFSSKILRRIIS